MYNVIIFDFFGVFCTQMATNWFKRVVPSDEAKRSIFQALCTQSDLGELSRAEFNQKAAKLVSVPVNEVEEGIEAELIINAELVAYVQKLRARGYRIACLSNGGREWTLQVIVDHGLSNLFEEVVLSADLGIVKPDLEIYSKTLEILKLSAAQALFVDDRKANVDAAEACGMGGLVFRDTPMFIDDFERSAGHLIP